MSDVPDDTFPATALGNVTELFPLLYRDLKRLAARRLDQQPHSTLQPTALVHELYLRLSAQPSLRFVGRPQFLALAARAMRAVLADRARARLAAKRDVSVTVSLAEVEPSAAPQSVDLLALEIALTRLAALDARQAQVVELRFFGGLTIDETATALDISEMTVKREWRVAKAWLRRELGQLTPKG